MKAISEQFVAYIWQHQLVTNLVTDTGEEVCVRFPGRPCSSGGSDFCDAVLTIGGRVIRGDIEIHIKSSQWYHHGHHRDSKYNNIALHVVMWHDCSTATVLQNKSSIPTVCLNTSLTHPLANRNQRAGLSYRCASSCQMAGRYFKGGSLLDVLGAAGEERFTTKVELFRRNLMKEDADQVLFRNIARALGYDKNAEPCERLAEMLPLRLLLEIGCDEGSIINHALIFGSSGLLPSQRLWRKHEIATEAEVVELETIWRSSNIDTTMNQSDWHFFRIRPENSPLRRLAALGYLVSKCRHTGLLQYILDLVIEIPGDNGHRWIENRLIIPRQGYWANHIDFGVVDTKCSALLGRNRAAEIAVNVVLPFVYAWGTVYAVSDLREKARKIYSDYPGLEDNQLVRFMKQELLLRPDLKLSGSQQQGLLHVFKNYCRYRNCDECPIAINRKQG